MMIKLTSDLITALAGKTLSTAESCTGGMIGAALTEVPGSSKVYKGGVVSYTNCIKESVLHVRADSLNREGAVSASVAMQMATGVRELLKTDYALSVTGLAGPGGDDFGNPVGTVFIGYADLSGQDCRQFLFQGTRAEIRNQATIAALNLLLEKVKE